jgi:flavin reductase (DIM6/NTAB) family NADH-FMN oxidoreductase RutF
LHKYTNFAIYTKNNIIIISIDFFTIHNFRLKILQKLYFYGNFIKLANPIHPSLYSEMQFNIHNTDSSTLYKLLTGTVIPRPIGWISTIDNNGINNLAPFSFFNVVCEDPPHVMFSTVRTGNKNKDTLNNILENKQFVVNLVTEEVVEKMNATSQSVAADIDEFKLAGVTPIDAIYIRPKRVKESLVHFECEMVHHYFIENHQNGGACIIIGKIIAMHIDDSILMENNRINLETYKPVARLAGSNYSKLGEIFSIKRG